MFCLLLRPSIPEADRRARSGAAGPSWTPPGPASRGQRPGGAPEGVTAWGAGDGTPLSAWRGAWRGAGSRPRGAHLPARSPPRWEAGEDAVYPPWPAGYPGVSRRPATRPTGHRQSRQPQETAERRGGPFDTALARARGHGPEPLRRGPGGEREAGGRRGPRGAAGAAGARAGSTRAARLAAGAGKRHAGQRHPQQTARADARGAGPAWRLQYDQKALEKVPEQARRAAGSGPRSGGSWARPAACNSHEAHVAKLGCTKESENQLNKLCLICNHISS